MPIETHIETNKPLKEFSTFGIGGNARYFVAIQTISEMKELWTFIQRKNISYWVLGKGSNSLFDDRGFDGLVILNKIDFIEFDEGNLHVGAGNSFSLLGTQMARKGWGGLEFASGIPGSVGGAVYMNAGANGGETADTLTHVGVIDTTGAFVEKSNLSFSYRTSPFQASGEVIVSARFKLQKEKRVREKQLQIVKYRTETQPYAEKSGGCVFRNPKGEGAGRLIEKCGLKGMKIGGAQVSLLHGNFILNKGNATAKDVMKLATVMQKTIREKMGYELEMEICPIPYSLRRN